MTVVEWAREIGREWRDDESCWMEGNPSHCGGAVRTSTCIAQGKRVARATQDRRAVGWDANGDGYGCC
jgi:hypothetical protein